MSNISEECWKSLITRYGPPLEPDSLDEDTLNLAIAERRALKTSRISDGCGGGDVYFHRAQVGDIAIKGEIKGKDGRWDSQFVFPLHVFPRPCEITDEEVAALDHPNPWESDSDLRRFTHRILAPGCWKSLITRYGGPLEPEGLDEDTLKLAITEQRALKVVAMPRYVGEDRSRRMYFQRAEAGDSIKGDYMRDRPYFCIVFPRPCEITDKEASILDRFFFNRWEEVCEFTDEILRLGSWRNLIARYGSPLYNDSLDENTLKLAIAERRALKVISRRDGFGEGEVSFEYAQVGDAIEGCIERYKFERHKRYYFCMVFPQPCQITDEEISSLQESSYGWGREDEFLKDIDDILATIGCWRSLISLYGSPLEPESLDDDTLKLAITERRALRLVKQTSTFDHQYAPVRLERAEVGNAIQGYTVNDSDRFPSLCRPYFSIVFSRPCEVTDEEIKILARASIWCSEKCEFINPTCTCYQAFFSMLAAKHCFC